MTEDVFRIVVAVVALAALAFVIQAGVMVVFYCGSKKTQLRLTRFMGDVKPGEISNPSRISLCLLVSVVEI
jgi:hypothetical protein